MYWIKKETESKLSWMHSLYILSKFLKETQSSQQAASASSVLLFLTLVLKSHPSLSGNVLITMMGNRANFANSSLGDTTADTRCNNIGLKVLIDQHCVQMDERSVIDFRSMIHTALHLDASPAAQQSQYQALSLLCSVFQIPQSIKMNLLERNLSNFNADLAQFIMHDVNVICELRAHSPDAFHTENAELSELVERLRSRMFTETGSEACTVNIGGYEMPCKSHHAITGSHRPSILNSVDTPTSAYNLRSLAQAVLTERPIIVQGSSGSGKSYIIRSLAVAMGLDADIIELHINDQTDSKTLIGSYVCSDVPGEFIWQAGVLTQAVLSGRWVVIENLDHVPLEFVAAIAPLLARRRIYLPHRDGEVPAHPNFRLFGTRTLPIPQLAQASAESGVAGEQASSVLVPPWQLSDFSAKDIDVARVRQAAAMVDYNTLIYMPTLQHFSHLFHYVCVHDLNITEVQRILITQHPTILPEIITKLLDVYLYINGEKSYGSAKAKTGASRMQKFGSGKKFGLREMLKAAGRIQANCGEFNHASGFVTDLQKRISLQEVVDVFAGSIRTVPAYEEVVQVLGGIWGIPESEVNAFFLHSGADVDAFFSQPSGAGDASALAATGNTIQRGDGLVKIGRATISTHPSGKATAIGGAEQQSHLREQNFAMTKYSLRLLERVAVCVSRNEPVLLVGETGTGKTTSVQELADILGKRLTVQNLSLSTDVSDLLGGYRPVTMKQLFLPMYEIFVRLFNDTLSSSQNTEFLQIVARFYQAQSWKRLLKAFLKAADQATKKLSKSLSVEKSKAIAAGDANSSSLQSAVDQWASFRAKIARYEANLPKIEFGFAFQFVDGLLVDALRNGDWVLLDEINLASSETLQGLSGVLDSEAALFLTEKGSGELVPVVRHPDFRVFAAMNPPTDIGKKELPASLLGRFTELYTEELVDPIDLRAVVERYLAGINTTAVADIVSVYLGCRAAAEDHMTDSTGQRPRYSLRSLTRSLQAAKSFLAIGIRPFSKALFEAFLLNFQTMLSETSRGFMHTYLRQSLYSEGNNKELAFPPSRPGGKATTANDWVLVKPFWLRAGPLTPVDWAERDDQGMTRFVLTKTVESNIRSLAAAVGAQVAPILIQGPTSIGKTSMVEYLAARCGFKCVRINNHEHTDVQEYIGGYVTNSSGQLEFKDGLLVEALRKGHWIILDELNLAPSDVLEALNRLLDDNKELLIPETGELVKPAFGFTLFATQNPPGIYGGRKPLSRAFKNRFLELSVCDLPLAEVEQIVTQSCGIPPKFSAMLVKTMQELQIHRQKSTLFQGKYGSITTRDLIKWGRRRPGSALEVAQEGYMLIAEKLRSPEEKQLVADILNKVCKAELVPATLYLEPAAPAEAKKSEKGAAAASIEDKYVLTQVQSAVRKGEVAVDGMSNIAVTATMRRMWELVNRALKQNEPVLLIGETGCGKTTVCQLYAAYKNQKIRILNCHQSTETADLIGGLRPIRGREAVKAAVLHDVHFLVRALADHLSLTAPTEAQTTQEIASSDKRESPTTTVTSSTTYPSVRLVYQAIGEAAEVTAELQAVDEAVLKAALDEMADALKRLNEEDGTASPLKKLKRDSSKPNKQADPARERFAAVSVVLERALLNWQRCRSLFEWQDGPLITAMKDGDVFVIDEINLAEDAVIERLNSVLESGRSITLAEKGGMSSELIVAHPNFKLLATMNPGGDFGKRELSPALRSRFTEVWIPNATDPADIALIVKEILSLHTADHGSSDATTVVQSAIDDSLSNHVAYSMIEFMEWMNVQCSQWMLNGIQISVREILAWAKFINQSSPKCSNDVHTAYIHGAFMIMLDGLGIGMSVPREKIRRLKHDCLVHLVQQCAGESSQVVVDSSEFFLSSAPSQSSELSADGGMSAVASLITVKKTDFDFSVGSFSIPLGPLFQGAGGIMTQSVQQKEYVLDARITTLNLGRILRAMQLPRAILLEGPPGVGKSSLIANLAALTGHTLVRINLSEHSELSDLLGTDLPAAAVTETSTLPDRSASSIALDAVEGEIAAVSLGADAAEKTEGIKSSGRSGTGNAPNFKWCDGVFLTAMKQGHWVLLDELNLAPQSVLEGLNACFDHRQEVFLPDIGQTVTCPPSFRVFCAQNPMVEGGGRKGLPQSFLSRFSRVFVEAMTEDDLLEIVSSAFTAPLIAKTQESPLEAALEAAAEVEACMDIEEEEALSTEIRELAAVPAELKAYIAPMVRFTQCLQNSIVENGAYGHTGGPWEFNLRDIFRWCELVILLLNKRDTGATMEVRNNVVSAAAYVLFVRRMRTAEDRGKLCADFASVFGFPLIVDDCPAIETPSTEKSTVLSIGAAALPVLLSPHYLHRNLLMCDAISGLWRAENAPTMQVFAKTLETLMHCISLQWPVLLVGAHGSGKHRVMQYLAAQTGHVVDHFAVSPSTDSTELLGSFEQVSTSRHLHLGVSFLQQACVVVLRVVLHASNAADVEGIEHLRDLCATATAQFQQVYEDSLLVSENNSLHLDEGKKLLADIQGLVDKLWEFANSPVLTTATSVVALGFDGLRTVINSALLEIRTAVKYSTGGEGSSGFEWVDGIIVKAVLQGKWLVIDNINLCSASVLDRLNSLLEPNGTLLLTECGDGRIITPHKDFRIFFCMDPSLGEISRAMRNRCVEVAFLPTDSDNKWSISHMLVEQEELSPDVQLALHDLCVGLGYSPSAAESTGVITKGLKVKNTHALLSPHFPKYQLFSRVVQLLALNVQNGALQKNALATAIDTVLPGFVAKATLHAVSHVDNAIVAEIISNTDPVGRYKRRIREAFNQAYVSQDIYMALDLLPELTEGKQLSNWVYQIISQAERRSSQSYCPLAEYIRSIKAALAPPAAITEGEDTVSAPAGFSLNLDVQQQTVLVLNLLVALTFSASSNCAERNWQQQLVMSLLQDLDLQEQYAFWLKKCHRYYSLTADRSDGAAVTVEFSSARWNLVQIAQFERALVLEQERLSAEAIASVRDPIVLQNRSSTQAILSVYSVALGIRKDLIVIDSRELSIINAIYQVVTMIDQLVDKMLQNDAAVRLASTTNPEYETLLANVRHVLLKRDALCQALCTAKYFESGSAQQNQQLLPWDEISICTRWLKKYVKQLGASYLPADDASAAMRDACAVTESELSRFDRAVCAYWHRPVMTEKLRLWKEGGHAAVPALPLNWKLLFELRDIVNLLRDDESCSSFTDTSVRKLAPLAGYQGKKAFGMQKEWLFLYSTFYWACTNEESVDGNHVSGSGAHPQRKKNVNIASLMAGLKDKFLEYQTATVLPDLLVLNDTECFDYDDGSGGGMGLQYTEYVHNRIQRERNAACEQSLCAMVEPVVIRNLLYISNQLSKVLLNSTGRGSKLLALGDISAAAPGAEKDNSATDWTALRDLAVHTVDLALRYTGFHPSQLRELQSLAWAIDAYLASTKSTAANAAAIGNAKLSVLLQLARVFAVTLETRIFAFAATSTANHLQSVMFDFSSQTLGVFLDVNSNNTGSSSASTSRQTDQPSLLVPWEYSLAAGFVRLVQPVSAEIASRHLDIQTVSARYQNGGSALKLLNYNTATATISSCKIARKRLYQLMRATVSAANRNSATTVQSESSSILSDIQRLDLLKLYVQNVLMSCRDFYDASLFAAIRGAFLDNTTAFDNLAALNIFASIENPAISTLFSTCLQPVLGFIAAADSSASLGAIGVAWVQVGLLRMHLLLPTMPVDPAAKSAIKSRLLQQQNVQLHQSVCTSYVHHSLGDSTLITLDMVTALGTLDSRKIAIERLNGRGIQRPDSSVPFVEVYFEIKSALEGIVSVERVHNLLNSISECLKVATEAGASTRTNTSTFSNLKSVLREELAWQATAQTLVQRLEQNYSAYEDIVSAIVSAVSNISHGMRLVAGAVHQTCASATRENAPVSAVSKDDASTSAYVSVMQFPFSVSVPLSSSSSLVTVNASLLKPVSLLLAGLDAVCDKVTEALTICKTSDAGGSILSKRMPDPRSIAVVVPHIVLLHALSRIEYLVSGSTVDLSEVYSVFQNTLDKFVEAYLKELDEKRRKAAAKEALFRNREKVFESDDLKEEEAAFKEHFPDHLAAFKSLNLSGPPEGTADTVKMALEDDEDQPVPADVAAAEEEEAEEERMMVDDNATTEVVSHHVRMVFFELVKHCAELHLTYRVVTESQSGADAPSASALINQKHKLQQSLSTATLITSKALDWALRGVISPSLDAQLRGTSLMGLSAMAHKCVFTDVSYQSPFDRILNTVASKKTSIKRSKPSPDSPDRDLLLLLNDQTDDAAPEWKPLDFHKNANPQESYKATEILQNIFDRSSELLVQFPGNELLLQVCKVSAKISEFHLTTPIGKMLISLQLLLQKAEEWEMFAAKHVSLRAQMSELSGLIAEWRELELKSWETLLRSKEVEYARTATLNWYALMRMLNGQPIVIADPVAAGESVKTEPKFVWPGLDVYAPLWLKTGYRSALVTALSVEETAASVADAPKEVVMAPKLRKRCPEMFSVATEQTMTESQYLAKIFTTLDGFMRSSVVGEYPTRLHLVRLFALQLQLECKVTLATGSTSAPGLSKKAKRKTAKANSAVDMAQLKERLANIVTGIWQYYDQFLPSLRKFQDTLKAPIQTRLKGEVKIGKWDQLNTYALIEYSEKIHRKLNKFLREYQGDVLDHPFSAILRRELLDDFVTKSGELQSATEVPPVGSMCPALFPLGDGISGTNPLLLLQSPISNSDYFAAEKLAASAMVVLDAAKDLQGKFPRIFMADTYASRMRKYLTELLIPEKVDMPLAPAPVPAPVPVQRKVVSEAGDDNSAMEVSNDETEMDVEVVRNDYFHAQIFNKKACYGLQGALLAEDLCQEIFSRVESLRSEDVAKPIKQRAVRDMLTTLKDHGISHLRSTVSAELRQNLQLFSTNAPLSCETMSDLHYSSSNPKHMFNKAELYYSKAISEVTQLRAQSTAAISNDISNRDASTMVALSENMLSAEVKLRASIGAALGDYKSLLSTLDSLNSSVSMNSNSSSCTVVPTASHAELAGAARINQTVAQVMLDNLIQLHSLLQSAADSNATNNIEDDYVIPVVPASVGRKAIQVIANVISLVAGIATSGDHGGQSVRDLSEQSPLVHMGPLALSTKVTLSTAELAALLKQQGELAKQADTLFRSVQAPMTQLVSADVIAPLQVRMTEFVANIEQNLTVANAESSVSRADQSGATDAQSVLTNVLDSKPDTTTSTLGTLVSKCIDDCLVSVQKLRSLTDLQALSTSAMPFTGCYGESIQKYQARDAAQPATGVTSDAIEGSTPSQQVILVDCVTLSVSSLAACQLHKVTADITQVQAYLNSKVDTMSVAEKAAASNVVRTVAPVLKLLRQAFTVLLDGLVLEYKSFGKLLYIVVRIFRTLLSKGICSSSVEEGEDDGSGDLSGMLFQDNIDGTGMGEGEGKKDVSDQIENEEQLLGLKDDAPKDPGEAKKPPEKKKLNEEEKDQGVEMTQDFEGEMFDIPSDDENDNNDSEDEDGEEPEKEMGDANAEDIVDEKQWDDEDQDSDAGEEGNNKEQEKFEKDSKMQGEAIEGEMRTKEDDEGGDDKPEEDKDGDKNKAPEKSDDAEPDPQQGGAEPEENKINEDKEDGTMDKPLGVDVRKEEPEKPEPQPDNAEDSPEEQMPEEGEAEGQEEKEGEGGEEGKPQEGDENGGDDQDGKDGEGDDLPDDMNLDGDDQSEDAMDVDDQQDPEAPPDTEEPEDSEEPHPDHNEPGTEGEEPEVDGNQLPVAGAGDLPDQDHNNPEEEQEKKEEEEEEPEDQPADADADPSKPASFGVRNDQGQEALLNAADDEVVDANEDNRNASKEQQNQPPSALSAEQPQGKGGQSQGESKKGATHEVGGTHREDDGDQPPPVRKQEPPNPFKQAGNVNEKWHRRLNMVLPPDEGENDAGQEEDGMNDANDSDDVPDGGGKGLYEHASKEEGAMEQVLADAAEEDQVQLPESGEQKDSQQDTATAMEQDSASPDDAAKEDPQEDRKRDRDEERYKGHKAKKKRLNDDAAPEPVEGELDAESEDHVSESADESDEQANSDDEADSEAESDVPGNEDKSSDTKDIFDGSKVFTKEAFKFGATTDLQQVPEPEQTDDIMVNQTDTVVISANRLVKGRLVWQQHRMATESYSMRLCEQLRLILEPTLATRLRGDYRTGKRINMRKVIPYVASGFRKDKIWLRRTKPAKRAYQVMIMIDDSMSMGAAGPLALSSLATIANALTRLEIGELSITSFATDVNVLHKFGTPFTEEAGARVVSQFKFQASSTLLSASLAAVLPVFTQARTSAQNSAAGTNAAVLQICFVISDARIDSDNREKLENTVRMLSEQHILVVLVIIDCNDDPKDSIFNTKSVSFVGNKVVTKSYFDDFPFPYYVALQKVEALPDVLSDALKQWFELVRLQTSN